jgi:hypothetical protein
MHVDFGIVVALKIELDAVRNALDKWTDILIPGAPPFLRGTLAGFRVAVTMCSDLGSVCSSLAALAAVLSRSCTSCRDGLSAFVPPGIQPGGGLAPPDDAHP